ncbi:sensor histidine kinase [Pseudomonas sp. 5P_3.1_Bac2]|uniref:sensor histidine kinase n=1 Tax=Pseudomonas sp. 5P_3.1_Bac2 TaxID=2971617 RepID=UPI0021CACD10|nr:HAMP domain-containing sensor histidine kinase [Pseudomonas sp. 5P_3.1_Bac2]MCU1717110.1 HAMP domain-containing histidine kinase [Pseudomonas sp. 5P_3.1_Bac2]
MNTKQPFAQRILVAFVLMTAIVSGLFSLGIVAVVHFIEGHLVSQELGRELSQILHEDLKHGRAPRLDASTRFFASDSDQYPIPPQYGKVKEGFNEMVEGDQAYYLYGQEINGRTYLLVQEQHEFESREQALFNVVLAGFLFAVLASWGLGVIMARKVMAPISRLAGQVRHRDQLHSLAPPLAPQYPDDEVGQLASAFDSTLGQVRQSLERERLFTSDVSHELRTPLMIIATSCELLAEGQLSPREQEQLARINRACDDMQHLVQTFLQLARDKRNASVDIKCGVQNIIEAQVSHWAPLIEQKGLSFNLRYEGQPPGLFNPTLLATVLSNLLRNALHYTESGHVNLIVTEQGFSVEDTGIGIPTEQQEYMFQPFVRGQHNRGEGLGLGLSLVKRICQAQGWQINLNSSASGGSCFNVILFDDQTESAAVPA